MSRVQFEIEQDEEANVFVASWDDPTGGGITTQARSLSELYDAIQEFALILLIARLHAK